MDEYCVTGMFGERHLAGYVDRLWRIRTPETISIGNCFLRGRLKAGDLFWCWRHNGDFFQDYAYVEEYANGYEPKFHWRFGSYGIGDSEEVELSVEQKYQFKMSKELFDRDGTTPLIKRLWPED